MPWRIASRLLSKLDRLSIDPNLAAVRRVHSEKRKGQLGAPRAHPSRQAQDFPGPQFEVDIGVLTRARQTTHFQRRSRFTGKRWFDAAIEDVAGDELAQPAPIKLAHGIGSKIAAVPHHRHPFGNIHHLVEPVTNKKAGDLLALQLMNHSQKSLDLLVAQGRGRLVHDDQPRLRRQRAADRHQLARGNRAASRQVHPAAETP